jgi:hypothetical protein
MVELVPFDRRPLIAKRGLDLGTVAVKGNLPCFACGAATTPKGIYRQCVATGEWGAHCDTCGRDFHLQNDPSLVAAECPNCGECGMLHGLILNESE